MNQTRPGTQSKRDEAGQADDAGDDQQVEQDEAQ